MYIQIEGIPGSKTALLLEKLYGIYQLKKNALKDPKCDFRCKIADESGVEVTLWKLPNIKICTSPREIASPIGGVFNYCSETSEYEKEVVCIHNAKEKLKAAFEEEPDIVITDGGPLSSLMYNAFLESKGKISHDQKSQLDKIAIEAAHPKPCSFIFVHQDSREALKNLEKEKSAETKFWPIHTDHSYFTKLEDLGVMDFELHKFMHTVSKNSNILACMRGREYTDANTHLNIEHLLLKIIQKAYCHTHIPK